MGRMLTAETGAVRREDTKDLGAGARTRGEEQRMKTESKRDQVLIVHSWTWRSSRIQTISSVL